MTKGFNLQRWAGNRPADQHRPVECGDPAAVHRCASTGHRGRRFDSSSALYDSVAKLLALAPLVLGSIPTRTSILYELKIFLAGVCPCEVYLRKMLL